MTGSLKASSLRLCVVAAIIVGCFHVDFARVIAEDEAQPHVQSPLEALIIEPDAVTGEQIAAWKKEGFKALVLILDERFESAVYQKTAKVIAANSLDLYYWIEVGRNPSMAREHPEWMASFGSHDDWQKLFPDVRQMQKGEVAKVWPWTPIGYREAFDAHLARLSQLLKRVPADYRGLLLNDLQGGPSSCGCGNLQCRWAIDYGVSATAAKLSGSDVAAKFLTQVQKLATDKEVIPVWTTECEQHDLAPEKRAHLRWSTGYCGTVDCFDFCLNKFTEQWQALHTTHRGPTGILVLHREFQRDRKEYGGATHWITHAVSYLDQLKLEAVPHQQLWLVVQGYDVTPKEEAAARQAALQTGAGAVLVARTRIDQSYEPCFVRAKP